MKPPYYAVIFSSKLADAEGYAGMADRMVELAEAMPGYLGIESVRGEDGVGITVSYWESEEAIKNWKANEAHLAAQKKGKEKWYGDFELRIARVERAYGKNSPPQHAPDVRAEIAAEANNRAWDLVEKEDRTEEEEEEMVASSYAAAYVWHRIGQPIHKFRADTLLAIALSLAHQEQRGAAIAERAAIHRDEEVTAPFDEAMWNCAVALAKRDRRHHDFAKALGQKMSDDDREVFEKTFRQIAAGKL